MLTLTGMIVEEAVTRVVKVRQDDVVTKEIKLQENDAKIAVTLWREHASTELQVGQYIVLENVIIRKWNNENCANTTSRTVIKRTGIPARDLKAQVIGYEDGDIDITLTCWRNEEAEDHKTSIEDLKRQSITDNVQEELDIIMPFPAHISVLGNRIVELRRTGDII